MQNINNRFDIIKEIGKGEFGVIYKVKDKFAPDYGIKALKIFNSDKIDKDNLKYFKKEFINLRNNELPCVVQVSEFSKIYHIDGRRFHGSYYFYTMEYLKGQNLSNYSFFNKKEKIKIFNRINFNLKYLHKNDYMHGDLSDKNIFITSDRNIIFLDLMDLGSKKEDNEMFKYLLDKYNVLMENFNEDYSEKINPKRFLQNLKNRFNPSVRYNSEVLQQLNNQLDKITSNEKESFIINYRNCRKDYFKAILKYIGGNLQTEGYSVINLFLNPSPYSFLKQLLLIITQKAKDKEILKEYKKFKNFLVNKEKSEFENFELSQIKLLTSELLEKLSLKSKQVIVLDSFDMIDEKSSQILQYLFKYYSGKQIVFFINNDRYSPDKKENSFRYIDANLNPLHEKYSKTNYSKLKRLFYPFDIETIIDTLSKNKYYDIFEIINFVVNQFNYKKKITVKMLENIDIEKAVKSKNAILGHYLNRERYEKLLGYINYMNKPIKIKYFRDILKEEYKILIDELINSQIISFFDNRRLTIKRKNILIYLKEYFIEKSPEYLKDIKNEIIRIYEKYENEISFDEKTTLIQLYAGKKNYKKAADILWKDFIKNRELNVEVFEQNLGNILNKIFTEKKNKKFKSEDIEAIFRIAYAKFYYNNESRKQTEVLDKINQDDIDSNGILFELNYSLFFNYFDLYKKQKIKEYYHKLKRISDELSFEDELKFVYAGFRFFQYFNKYKKMKKFLNQFFTLIKDKDDQYTKDYLRGLNSLYTYYSNYEKNDKKAYNTVNLFLKKAKEFGSDFYTYSAYTNLGVYRHYHGQKNKAYKAFKQALKYAKKSSDFSILPTAYNNMAITFSDPLKAREYYKTAFDYAYKLEDYSTAYVLIHNLSELMGNEKFLGIVEKNKNFLFEKEIARGSLRTFLYFYYSLIISCHQKNELKKFNGFYKFLKSIDCEKSNSFYNSYSYFIILSKIILEGYKDYFDEIQNLLKKVSNYHFDLVVDSIIKWIFVYLDKSKKIKILDEIIKNGKEKLEKQHFSTYKILKKILKKEKIDYNQLLRKIENKPEYDTAYFHILLHYSKILKTNKKEEYQKYLSFVCKKIKAIKNRYKSENLFKKTYYKMLFDKIKKSFPEEYHKIFEENENLIIRDIDYEKYINDMYFNDKRNTKKYMDVFLKNCLKITNFDRAIFYEKKDDDFVELKRYIQNPFLYGDYDLCDFRKYLEDIENNILIRDINKKFVDIEKILIIPIIDFDKYKRYKYTKENKNKSILSTSEKDYLLGILYLDRINGAKIGTPKYILKFIQIFFNEYWNRYVSYEKYIKDDLTGLLLKNVFLKKVSESIYESTGQNKRHLSFLLLDIDNFKEINDKYGHQKGDEILKKLAWIIKKATRDTDLVGRYGGEEFIIALNETPKSSAYEVAERIRQTIQKKQLMGNLRELTVSIGISSYPQDSKWIEEIINKADDALYEAKDKGKNRVEVFLK